VEEMQELEILVTFKASNNTSGTQNDNWCDDIEVFIDYGVDR
jgi:hypothetical protein